MQESVSLSLRTKEEEKESRDTNKRQRFLSDLPGFFCFVMFFFLFFFFFWPLFRFALIKRWKICHVAKRSSLTHSVIINHCCCQAGGPHLQQQLAAPPPPSRNSSGFNSIGNWELSGADGGMRRRGREEWRRKRAGKSRRKPFVQLWIWALTHALTLLKCPLNVRCVTDRLTWTDIC